MSSGLAYLVLWISAGLSSVHVCLYVCVYVYDVCVCGTMYVCAVYQYIGA